MKLLARFKDYLKEKKINKTVKRINKIFGFKLKVWQVRYIFKGETGVPFERGTGKTFAHILKICLSSGETINLRNGATRKAFTDGEIDSAIYRDFYRREFMKVYNKLLESKKIRLRPIIFY